MKRRYVVVLVCIVLMGTGTAVLSGCSAKKSTANAADASQVAEVGATVNGEMKAGYPESLPLWSGATVVSSKHTDKGQFNVYELNMTTTASYSKVVYGYGKGLQNAGWDARSLGGDGTSTAISATKGSLEAAITISKDKSGLTSIVISVQM
ncbi:MAG: hypothetical protein JJE36_01615 [Coriobacteriia bacterium]|nr:hypothetical protein [Coriobacteriia bacterium]